jgi:hypothetical protein
MQLDLMCGPCDRLIISRSLKRKGGKFLGRMLEQVQKDRGRPPCDTVRHRFFKVDGKVISLKVKGVPAPVEGSFETRHEYVGHLDVIERDTRH